MRNFVFVTAASPCPGRLCVANLRFSYDEFGEHSLSSKRRILIRRAIFSGAISEFAGEIFAAAYSNDRISPAGAEIRKTGDASRG